MPDHARSIAPYARVPKWLMLVSGGHECLVFLALDSFDGRDGCYPSHAAIAERAGISVSSVRRALEELIGIGAVIVTPQPDRRSHLYDLSPAFDYERARYGPAWVGGSLTESEEVLTESTEARSTEREARSSDARSSLTESTELRSTNEKNEREVLNDSPGSRPDVDDACDALAEHVAEQMRGKRPTIGVAWRRDMRLLIDRDEVPVADVLSIIEWLRGPGGARFWAHNVLSPSKLRERYPRLVAERDGRGGGGGIDTSLAARQERAAAAIAELRARGE